MTTYTREPWKAIPEGGGNFRTGSVDILSSHDKDSECYCIATCWFSNPDLEANAQLMVRQQETNGTEVKLTTK